jgi:imidazolonepropionase-like amidohydrolase
MKFRIPRMPGLVGQASACRGWATLGGFLIASALCAFAAAGDTFLIRNVDVYPVTGPMVKAVSVLVQDGRIADIGPKIAAPKGVRVVEGKGLRVYPGMIDSATDLGLSEVSSVRETVDTGELGEFMPQLRALIAVNPASEHFGVVRVNGITSAITFPGAGNAGTPGGRQLLSGQAALIHTAGWTWEEMAVRPSAAIQLNFPSMSRGGRGGGGMPAEISQMLQVGTAGEAAAGQLRRTYEEQLRKLDQFFDDARRYQKAKAANAAGLPRDLKFEAMIPVLEGKTPLAVSASRATSIRDAVAFAEKQKVKIVLLQPRDLQKVGPLLKEKNIPIILGRVLALPPTEDDGYDAMQVLAAQAHRAGVKFAFGTFANQFIRNLPYEAAAAVAFGLPYEEALKAITINAAEIWGAGDQLGSVEKGKWADLVITDGDLLEIKTQVKHVFIKGKEIELSNKQTKLQETYSQRQ